MNAALCPRQDELLEALGLGFIGAELAAHIDRCESCSEIRLVAGAVIDERVHAIAEAPIPSAGTMLWRMQMRQRRDAQAAARRSLFLGQAASLLIAFALLISFFGYDLAVEIREVIAAIRVSTPLLLAIATSLLVAPLAGWVAIRQK